MLCTPQQDAQTLGARRQFDLRFPWKLSSPNRPLICLTTNQQAGILDSSYLLQGCHTNQGPNTPQNLVGWVASKLESAMIEPARTEYGRKTEDREIADRRSKVFMVHKYMTPSLPCPSCLRGSLLELPFARWRESLQAYPWSLRQAKITLEMQLIAKMCTCVLKVP